jgi:cytochrome P450
MVLALAKRDQTRFADPDVFDLDRPRRGHASFGYGGCISASGTTWRGSWSE